MYINAEIIERIKPCVKPKRYPPIAENIPGGNKNIGNIDASIKKTIGAKSPNCAIKSCIVPPSDKIIFLLYHKAGEISE